MKKNKNITAVITIVGIFLILSIIGAIALIAIPTGGNVQDSSTGIVSEGDGNINTSLGDNIQGESSSQGTNKDKNQSSSQGNNTIPSFTSEEEYKAIWISYLEYQGMEMSTKEGFTRDITAAFKNCVDTGINTVIVHVRPFGDALYKSNIFPQSHLITGTQGGDAIYDPLEIMVDTAHSMGLKIEAWVNPYRIKLSSKMPTSISNDNPGNNQSLTFTVNGGVYYNPALKEVQELVVNGVEEIVRGYDVDGIHIDDYFYPTTDLSIDKSDFDKAGSTLSQADWRRENVNNLVKSIYAKIKEINANVTFGISPQGNNDNNYNSQYSDVKLWLSTPGYADYVMPQLYWGFNYLTKSGIEDFQFEKLSRQWESYNRAEGVKLYIGLGAYRIGDGDAGNNPQEEWSSGENLARMVNHLRTVDGISGFALYRYDNIFKNATYPELSQKESQKLQEALKAK